VGEVDKRDVVEALNEGEEAKRGGELGREARGGGGVGEGEVEEEETYVYNKSQSMLALICATPETLNIVSPKLIIEGTNLNTFLKKLGPN